MKARKVAINKAGINFDIKENNGYLCQPFLQSFFVMDSLRPFVIPIGGLQLGIHQYRFEIASDFFDYFEDSVIKSGEFVVKMQLDKRHSLYVLDFEIEGVEYTTCDRCLEQIGIAVEASYQLFIKFGEDQPEEADVVWIPEGTSELSVAQYVYEFVSLSVPMVKVYDCHEDDNPPCNQEVLKRLEGERVEGERSLDEEDNPWSALKALNKLNKEQK